jgi:hypothetical protein
MSAGGGGYGLAYLTDDRSSPWVRLMVLSDPQGSQRGTPRSARVRLGLFQAIAGVEHLREHPPCVFETDGRRHRLNASALIARAARSCIAPPLAIRAALSDAARSGYGTPAMLPGLT